MDFSNAYKKVCEFMGDDCPEKLDPLAIKLFPLIVLFWFLLWAFAAFCCLGNIPVDVSENLAWGRHIQFGYDKNPYVGALLSRLLYVTFGRIPEFSYFAGQLSLSIAFICVWILCRKIMSPAKALLAVVFLFSIRFFSTWSVEFNDDIMEMSLWALTVLFFYNSLKKQKIKDWLLTGLFAGLSFMTKYYGVVLFAPMGLVVLFSPQGRASFKKAGMYLAVLVFILLSLPNLIWLYQNEFVAFSYALGRANLDSEVVRKGLSFRFSKFFEVIGASIEMAIPPFIAFALIFFKRSWRGAAAPFFEKFFLGAVALGPLTLTFLFALLTGGDVKTSWLTPCYTWTGAFLFYTWNPSISIRQAGLFSVFTVIFVFACLVYFGSKELYLKPFVKNWSSYETYPGQMVGSELTRLWNKKFRTRLKYVISSREGACNFAMYSSDEPEVYFSANRLFSNWIDEEDIKKCGALVLWEREDSERPGWLDDIYQRFNARPKVFVKAYPRASKPWFRALLGREPKTTDICYAFLAPQEIKPEE